MMRTIVIITLEKKFFKYKNIPNKTENTNIFHKENNIIYDLNKYFFIEIYECNRYNNSNYKNLDMR